MPCNDPSHTHTWPRTGPAKFRINSCELICGYCENGRKRGEGELCSVAVLRNHVWSCHLGRQEFPGVELLSGREPGEPSTPQSGKKKRKRQSDDQTSHTGEPTKSPKEKRITYSNIWRYLPHDFDERPPQDRIDLLHDLLFLQPTHHATFQQLTTRYFQEPINDLTIPQRIAERGEDTIAKEVGFFLHEHGASLWPAHLPRRTHLCKTPAHEKLTQCWRSGKGPTLVIHRKISPEAKKRWQERHDGKEPELEDELAISNFGEALQAYVAALLEMGSLDEVPETSYDEVKRLKSLIVDSEDVEPAMEKHSPDAGVILGLHRNAPTANRLLREQPNMTTFQLVRLRTVLDKSTEARTDFEALTKELQSLAAESNGGQSSPTDVEIPETPEGSSRDSSPEIPLSAARRPVTTPRIDAIDESSAQRRDQSSKESSPDVPLREMVAKPGRTATPKQLLVINTTGANASPAANMSEPAAHNVAGDDAAAEPDLFQQLLDAPMEPLSAEEMQSAQTILEASSLASATTDELNGMERCLKQILENNGFAVSPRASEGNQLLDEPASTISPRATAPVARPSLPLAARTPSTSSTTVPPTLILRSNNLDNASSPSSIAPPPHRRSDTFVYETERSASVYRPRMDSTVPFTAPPQQVAFPRRTTSAHVQAQALSEHERTMLAQQFRETGGLGGLPLVLRPSSGETGG